MINPETLFQLQILPELSQGECHVFTWAVPEDLPYFDGHFPGNPVLPAIAVLDGTLEALKLLTGDKTISFEKIRTGKFLNIITPGTVLRIRLTRIQGKGQCPNEWEAEWKSPTTQKIFAHLKLSLRSGGTN